MVVMTATKYSKQARAILPNTQEEAMSAVQVSHPFGVGTDKRSITLTAHQISSLAGAGGQEPVVHAIDGRRGFGAEGGGGGDRRLSGGPPRGRAHLQRLHYPREGVPTLSTWGPSGREASTPSLDGWLLAYSGAISGLLYSSDR